MKHQNIYRLAQLPWLWLFLIAVAAPTMCIAQDDLPSDFDDFSEISADDMDTDMDIPEFKVASEIDMGATGEDLGEPIELEDYQDIISDIPSDSEISLTPPTQVVPPSLDIAPPTTIIPISPDIAPPTLDDMPPSPITEPPPSPDITTTPPDITEPDIAPPTVDVTTPEIVTKIPSQDPTTLQDADISDKDENTDDEDIQFLQEEIARLKNELEEAEKPEIVTVVQEESGEWWETPEAMIGFGAAAGLGGLLISNKLIYKPLKNLVTRAWNKNELNKDIAAFHAFHDNIQPGAGGKAAGYFLDVWSKWEKIDNDLKQSGDLSKNQRLRERMFQFADMTKRVLSIFESEASSSPEIGRLLDEFNKTFPEKKLQKIRLRADLANLQSVMKMHGNIPNRLDKVLTQPPKYEDTTTGERKLSVAGKDVPRSKDYENMRDALIRSLDKQIKDKRTAHDAWQRQIRNLEDEYTSAIEKMADESDDSKKTSLKEQATKLLEKLKNRINDTTFIERSLEIESLDLQRELVTRETITLMEKAGTLRLPAEVEGSIERKIRPLIEENQQKRLQQLNDMLTAAPQERTFARFEESERLKRQGSESDLKTNLWKQFGPKAKEAEQRFLQRQEKLEKAAAETAKKLSDLGTGPKERLGFWARRKAKKVAKKAARKKQRKK